MYKDRLNSTSNVEDHVPDYFDRLAEKHGTTREEEVRRASQVPSLKARGNAHREAHSPATPSSPTLRVPTLTPRQARLAPLVGALLAGQFSDSTQDPSGSSAPTAPSEDTSPPQS